MGVPFAEAFRIEIFPQDRLGADGDLETSLNKIEVLDFENDVAIEGGEETRISLSFTEAVSFGLIGIDGFAVVFDASGGEAVTLSYASIERGMAVGLTGGFRLEVASQLLRPVRRVGRSWEPDPDQTAVAIAVESDLALDIIEGEWNLAFEGAGAFSIRPFEIADTGMVIEASGVSLHFSDGAAPPPGTAPGFKGVAVAAATLHLPQGIADILPEGVAAENVSIGSGGFSGAVSLDWGRERGIDGYDESAATSLFGFGFTLQALRIEFKQNALVGGSIEGFLQLPFFGEALKVELGITQDGGYTLAVGDGPLTVEKESVIAVEMSSLAWVTEGDESGLQISGKVRPLLRPEDLQWPSFDLQALVISSDGSVRIEGGWIDLPAQKALDFYGFKVEISRLGLGSDELDRTSYNWIGFSGGIQIAEGLPLKGGVEGLKVMWDEDGAPKLKIGGVALGFEIPNVLGFDGQVLFVDEDVKEFRGGVDIRLMPFNGLGLKGSFATGKADAYNYFYLGIDAELPLGVPVVPPVVGLYGLAGLYGHNMSLDYDRLIGEFDPEGGRPDLLDVDASWGRERGAMAFGAGLTVGTLPDAKFTAKAQAMLAILIPGPVVIIEGQAAILSLGGDYPAKVMAVLDPSSGTFLMNISAGFEFPKRTGGDLLLISGLAEAFFSAGDLKGWHVYLGQNKPESKRIRADLLSFFKAQSYLMVDPGKLRMGVWIGYKLNEKYGILRVILEAWFEGRLSLSTMPFQADGALTLFGRAELSAGVVSLGISVEANIAAEAPKPFAMLASLKVQLKTPLGNPKAKIKLEWSKKGVPAFPIPLSPSLGIEHRKTGKSWDVLKYSTYGVDDDGLYAGAPSSPRIPEVPLVPPDVSLVLNFEKPMMDEGFVGNNPSPAPPHEKVGGYSFKYALRSATLACRDDWNEESDDGRWESYEAYAERHVEDGHDAYSFVGAWQAVPDAGEVANTKLVVNATTPFEISRQLESNDAWLDLLGVYHPEYPCSDGTGDLWTCLDFEARPLGANYPIFVENGFIFVSDFPTLFVGYEAGWLGTHKALKPMDYFVTMECLPLANQEPSDEIPLKVIDNVLIKSGLFYGSSLKFTDEFSLAGEMELYINTSEPGRVLASIHFAEDFFGNAPYRVHVTCRVDESLEANFLQAYDQDGALLDEATLVEDHAATPHTYVVESVDSVPIRKVTLVGNGIHVTDICYQMSHSSDGGDILITAPEDMAKGKIHLQKGSSGTVRVYDGANLEIAEVPFDIADDIADEDVAPLEFGVEEQSYRTFLISGDFGIVSICGLSWENQQTATYNAQRPDRLVSSLEETWGRHSAQILHPDKYYRLKVETVASRKKAGGSWQDEVFTEYMYFKTGNPPGPPSALQGAVPRERRYDLAAPLSDLAPYVEATIPAAAIAGEAQTLAYRSYDVGVVYNDSYVDQMYQMADLPLKIKLLDNNHHSARDARGEELALPNQWGDNPELAETREETQYKNILDESGCIVIAVEETSQHKREVIASSRDLLLSPRTQYRAQVVAGADQVVYEFAFTTSRYASFAHHVHSFRDAAWDHAALADNPGHEVDASVLGLILDNGEEEAAKHEQLMDLFGLNPRHLPETVEITLLGDRRQSYGLLLETPEPIDWQRTTFELFRSDREGAVELFSGSVKIVDAGLESVAVEGVGEDYNRQWVDILLMETTDLAGFSLTYRPAAEDDDAVYYEFSGEHLFLAGTLLRVYNGPEPLSALPAVELSRLYAGHGSESFGPGGTAISLRDQRGEVVHRRVAYRDEERERLDSRAVINRDGTRAFVFIEDGGDPFGALAAGAYRLNFNFARLLDLETPALKRFGIALAEEPSLEFSLPPALPDIE